MPRLRKTLPRDLDALFEAAAASGDEGPVLAALERCEPDARGGYAKSTVLGQRGCTVSVARWAMARGTDIDAGDTYGRAPLHHAAQRAFGPGLTTDEVLDLGADPALRCRYGRTALHYATDSQHLAAVETLLAHGLSATDRADDGKTPLEYALRRMSNTSFPRMVPVARALLAAGDTASEAAKGFVRTAAERFEFHRDGFNRELLDETSAAVEALCQLMAVAAPAPRKHHDGTSPIVATADTWQRAHTELWELLVPSSGPCATVQGEVIRITGRISDELYRNGGGNWDRHYRMMADALLRHLASGSVLTADRLAQARAAASALLEDMDQSRVLAEAAVAWVGQNPTPVPLPPPAYQR